METMHFMCEGRMNPLQIFRFWIRIVTPIKGNKGEVLLCESIPITAGNID